MYQLTNANKLENSFLRGFLERGQGLGRMR